MDLWVVVVAVVACSRHDLSSVPSVSPPQEDVHNHRHFLFGFSDKVPDTGCHGNVLQETPVHWTQVLQEQLCRQNTRCLTEETWEEEVQWQKYSLGKTENIQRLLTFRFEFFSLRNS